MTFDKIYLNSEKELIENVCKALGYKTTSEFTTGETINYYIVHVDGIPKKYEMDLQLAIAHCRKIVNEF